MNKNTDYWTVTINRELVAEYDNGADATTVFALLQRVCQPGTVVRRMRHNDERRVHVEEHEVVVPEGRSSYASSWRGTESVQ